MSMLDAALSWAARGFRVFPLAEGTKNQPVVSFTQEATSDPAKIRTWWEIPFGGGASREYNIGVLTTGMVVIDIDVRDGKPGVSNYLKLGGVFDTLTVRTPSGGLHCYYKGPDSAGLQGRYGLGEGIDIRSHGNYVVAPGSRTPEGAYSVEIEGEPSWVPGPVASRLRPPITRSNAADFQGDETPGLVARAVTFLGSAQAPPAVEGEGGDDQTYRTVCRLRDLGLTQQGAYALLLQHWNDRCNPPWDPDDLLVKVENAYNYATGSAGSMTPEQHFANLQLPDPPPDPDAINPDIFATGTSLDVDKIPPRPWLMTRLLMRRQITLLVGPGSAGKSVTSLVIAAHLAVGLPFMKFQPKGGPTRSIVWDEEDDLHELSRRLWAICQHYGFDYGTVRNMVTLLSRKEIDMRITEGDPPSIATSHVQALVAAASSPDVGLLVLGPFVALHNVSEDDNVKMAFVMGILREIAEAADVAVLLAHHVSKPSGGNSRAGDAYAARGAGAIVNSARIAFTMFSPTEQECSTYGIKPERRFEFVRFDNAKMNLTLQTGIADWLQKHTLKLPNGDEVGVLAPYNMQEKTEQTLRIWALAIAGEMIGKARASCTLNEAADFLRAADPLAGKLDIKTLRTRVKTALSDPIVTPHGTLKVIGEMTGGTLSMKVVLG